jgi:hypothetical protein
MAPVQLRLQCFLGRKLFKDSKTRLGNVVNIVLLSKNKWKT